MHIVIRSLLFSLALAIAGFGQQPCPTVLANNVRISNLVIQSDSLPVADRERIIRLFQQTTYLQSEIGDRIQIALSNLGYLKAVIRESDVSFTAQQEGRNVADVTVKVEPGAQYRLREIYIQNATIFPSSQLRELFFLQSGDLLNATKVGQGLENLRNLYATRGYVNFVPSPEISIDESHHIIDLHIFVDEGKPFNFGQLYLEGAEPYAGAGKAIMDSWKSLEGKRYNSVELKRWFLANRSTWHAGPQLSQAIMTAQRPESDVVNVTLMQGASQNRRDKVYLNCK